MLMVSNRNICSFHGRMGLSPLMEDDESQHTALRERVGISSVKKCKRGESVAPFPPSQIPIKTYMVITPVC
jgi:hypothetical protein